jgi:uncharacterized membrane protein YcaP (DUF421 family)
MKKEDIHLGDLSRILFGEAPPVFLLEVFVRTLIVYVFLLYILRWLGKRMSGQLTIMELSVMLTLGAIVSASMQIPDHGILAGFLLLLCALGFQRGISYLGVRSSKFEKLTQGKAGILIRDGILQVGQMKEFRISRQQIFAQLRNQKIYQLGMVDRMYLEASGMYSVFKAKESRPGLAVLPPDDKEIGRILKMVPGICACRSCGFVQKADDLPACNECGCQEWTPAVKN